MQYNLPLARKMGSHGANAYMLWLSGYRGFNQLPLPAIPVEPQISLPPGTLAIKATKKQIEEDLAAIDQAGRLLSNLPHDIQSLVGKKITALEAAGLSCLFVLSDQLQSVYARLATALDGDLAS